MTEQELQAIKDRADKATGTQWKVGMASPNGVQNVGTVQGLMTAQVLKINDAEFIAHARQDVPALVTEVERYKKLYEICEGGMFKASARAQEMQGKLDRTELAEVKARMEVERLREVVWRMSDYCDLSVEETRKFLG